MGLSKCPSSVIRKLRRRVLGKSACPIRANGGFKRAHVCRELPYVYYSPIDRPGFNKDMANLKVITEEFPSHIRKFYLTALCSISLGDIGTNTGKTMLVPKMMTVNQFISSPKMMTLVDKFISFIGDFLRTIGRVSSSDRWKYIPTDMKEDNILVNQSGDIVISDFSPIRKTPTHRLDFVYTNIYILNVAFTDYNPIRRYNDKETSELALNIFLLECYVMLFFMSGMTLYDKLFGELVADLLRILKGSKLETLSDCHRFILTILKHFLNKKQYSTVISTWRI